MTRYSAFLLIVIGFAGCKRRGDSTEARTKAAEALRGVLAYPRSSLLAVSAGSEAAELTLSSPDSVGQVVAWYRQMLPLNRWTIRVDTRDRAGTATIYAEQERRPLWITLQSNSSAGTTYKLVGVLRTDSAHSDSLHTNR
jgi:hypothetical protein